MASWNRGSKPSIESYLRRAAFETLDGQDPVAYILSSNIQRRHLSKGQAAMATARVRDLSQITTRALAKDAGVSQARVAYAVVVIEYASELIEPVLEGAITLDAAYEQPSPDSEQPAEQQPDRQTPSHGPQYSEAASLYRGSL